MSSKSNSRLQKIQSLFRRAEWKQAYKECKFLAKQSKDAELNTILVTSLWNWTKELARRNQVDEAINNVRELLAFKDIPEEIRKEFPPVFRTLNVGDLLPEDLKQDIHSTEIQIEFVDAFLLGTGSGADLLPEVREDADRIRNAFEKIEAKQDSEAMEFLRPIAFRSPLADWRLFLRGLVDYYHGEKAKAQESWKRLSPDRPACRIAQKLSAALEKSQSQPSQSVFFNLYRDSQGDKNSKMELLDTLRVMDRYMGSDSYRELIVRFQTFQERFQQSDPIIFLQVQSLVCNYLIRHAHPEIVRRFIEHNLPLPLDPKGNRSFALLARKVYDQDIPCPSWLHPEPTYWQRYVVEDIDQIDALRGKMKDRAKAVVFAYIAKLFNEGDFGLYLEIEDGLAIGEAMLDHVTGFLDLAIQADPTYMQAYDSKAAYILSPYGNQDRYQPRIIEIYKALLEHVPDCIKALHYMINAFLASDAPLEAKTYLDRLREIDPLSTSTFGYSMKVIYSLLRRGLSTKDSQLVSEGLALFKDDLPKDTYSSGQELVYYALSCLNDLYLHKKDTLKQYIALLAKRGIEKQYPLLLAIVLEAYRLGIPLELIASYESQLDTFLQGRCHGNTAGAIGSVLAQFLLSSFGMQNRIDIVPKAVDFVARSGQVKWKNEKDLQNACALLWIVLGGETALSKGKMRFKYLPHLHNFAKRGFSLFPKSKVFDFFEAEFCRMSGRFYTKTDRFHARNEGYEMFLQQVDDSSVLDEVGFRMIDKAKDQIEDLDDPFTRFFDDDDDDGYYDDDDDDYGGLDGDYDDDDDDDEDYDLDDDDDDDEFDGQPHRQDETFAFNMMGESGYPPPFVQLVREHGEIPLEYATEMAASVPQNLRSLRYPIILVLEECILKNIPSTQFPEYMLKRILENDFRRKLRERFGDRIDFFNDSADDDDESWVEGDQKSSSKRKTKRNTKKKKKKR